MKKSGKNTTQEMDAKAAPKPAKGKAIRFVVVFVGCVFVLLAAYRYAIPTRASAWYLFQVARTTASLLNAFGYSCALESPETYGGREGEIRKQLAAMRRGETLEPVPPKPNEEGELALTQYEAWMYRFLKARDDPGKLTSMGPHVKYILRPSYTTRITDVKTRLDALMANESVPLDVRQREATAIQAEIDTLKVQREEFLQQDAASQEADKEIGFRFVVVPECGAIPSLSIFLAAVLAFPAGWWRRALGLLAGLPALFLVNTGRLATLAVIGAYTNGGPWFDFAHEYVWQGIYIVFVVACWLIWVELLVRRRP